jgi:hypothetical protein
MCNSCNSEKEQGNSVTRRSAIKNFLAIALGAIVGLFTRSKKAEAGWGRCSQCPCQQYQQSYGTDQCGNCGHSYSAHW